MVRTYCEHLHVWFDFFSERNLAELFCTTFEKLRVVKHERQRNCSIRYNAFDSERRRRVIQKIKCVSDYYWYSIMIFCSISHHLCMALPFIMNSICQTMLECGVCGFARSFFHLFYALEKKNRFFKEIYQFYNFQPKNYVPLRSFGVMKCTYLIKFIAYWTLLTILDSSNCSNNKF